MSETPTARNTLKQPEAAMFSAERATFLGSKGIDPQLDPDSRWIAHAKKRLATVATTIEARNEGVVTSIFPSGVAEPYKQAYDISVGKAPNEDQRAAAVASEAARPDNAQVQVTLPPRGAPGPAFNPSKH